jgi:uncharacterized protein (TIGR02996 family)
MSIVMDRMDEGQSLEPALAGMLAAIDAGDTAVLGMLADWLEERGDPRAALARAATQIDVELVAATLYRLRGGIVTRGDAVGAVVDMILIGVPTGADPFVSRADCVNDVRTAIEQKRLTAEVARAISLTRRAKIDQLLQQFKET